MDLDNDDNSLTVNINMDQLIRVLLFLHSRSFVVRKDTIKNASGTRYTTYHALIRLIFDADNFPCLNKLSKFDRILGQRL